MKIGTSISPYKRIGHEIDWIGRNKFDYVELNFDGYLDKINKINPKAINQITKRYNLNVYCHFPLQLYITSAFEHTRQAALKDLTVIFKLLKKLNTEKVVIHPFYISKHLSKQYNIDMNIKAFQKIMDINKKFKFQIVTENLFHVFDTPDYFQKIFKKVPKLNLCVDVGHCNLESSKGKFEDYIKKLPKKIKHLHIADNYGKKDIHIPMGAGFVDWKKTFKLLKKIKYNESFTFEVFAPDRDYLLLSREKLLKWY